MPHPRPKREPATCPVCSAVFAPVSKPKRDWVQRTCSLRCAALLRYRAVVVDAPDPEPSEAGETVRRHVPRPNVIRENKLAGTRRTIPAATDAAIWALSSGRCYAPECSMPVVFEVRPGVYRKNAQIGHMYGVKKGAPRYDETISDEERDSFVNLVLVCLPHHAEIDDRRTGEERYPREVLRQWKTDREGGYGPALANIGRVDEESLAALLIEAFAPPIQRLEDIADQFEQTGALNAQALQELRAIISVMAEQQSGPDRNTAMMLSDAAEIYGNPDFSATARRLVDTGHLLAGAPFTNFGRNVDILSNTLADNAEELRQAAGSIAQSVQWFSQNEGSWPRQAGW